MIKRYKIGVRSDGDWDYDIYVLSCDNCHKSYGNDAELFTFEEAVALKKKLMFRSIKSADGTWKEFCPECYTKMKRYGL